MALCQAPCLSKLASQGRTSIKAVSGARAFASVIKQYGSHHVGCLTAGSNGRCVAFQYKACSGTSRRLLVTANASANSESTPEQPRPTVIHSPFLPTLDALTTGGTILLLDKPQEWTSFDVCAKLRGTLKHVTGLKKFKVGHAGTLDPMATGLLIVCAGKATKLVDSFTNMDKVYTGTLKLGENTPSYDAETEVDETLPWEHLTNEDLSQAADTFLGPIQQVPPIYSAIKMGGEALYKKARRGETSATVEIKARAVTIKEFSAWREDETSPFVKFRIECSKGTYIRSLVYDIGRHMGTVAHMTELRRESIGEYSVQEAWDVAGLVDGLQDAKATAAAAAVTDEHKIASN